MDRISNIKSDDLTETIINILNIQVDKYDNETNIHLYNKHAYLITFKNNPFSLIHGIDEFGEHISYISYGLDFMVCFCGNRHVETIYDKNKHVKDIKLWYDTITSNETDMYYFD